MKWIGRSTLIMMSTIAIVATEAATAHAACPVLDPLCVIEEAVDDGVGLVEDTVGGIETPVDDVLDPLEEVVDPVVDTIFGTVDDVIGGGGGEQPEPPGGGTGNGGGGEPGVHVGGPEPSGPGGPDRGPVDVAGPRIHERPQLGRVFGPVVVLHPVADATGSPVEEADVWALRSAPSLEVWSSCSRCSDRPSRSRRSKIGSIATIRGSPWPRSDPTW